MLARVPAVWDAEAKVEVKVLEEATLEVVPFDHPEAVDWPVAHRELHTEVCLFHRHTNGTEVRGREQRRPLGGTELFWLHSLTLHRQCAVSGRPA